MEFVLELEELNLDYQDGSKKIIRVIKSRLERQESPESEGDVTRDINQAVTLIIRNGGQAWLALISLPLLFVPMLLLWLGEEK